MGMITQFFIEDTSWKLAVLQFFIFTFQTVSCYFVLLVVVLRISMVTNPTGFRNFHKKFARILVIIIYFFAVILNTVPIFSTMPAIVGPYAPLDTKNIGYIVALHLGLTTPVLLSMFGNVFQTVYLARRDTPYDNVSKQEKKRGSSFQKLINGYVIWLIICNCPYIAMFHYAIHSVNTTQPPKAYKGIEGVICIIQFSKLIIFLLIKQFISYYCNIG